MLRNARELLRSDDGQGMTEYILTTVLVAIAAIGVVNLLGYNLRTVISASAAVLGGETNAVAKGELKATGAKSLTGSFNAFESGAGAPGGKGDNPNIGETN